MLQLTPQMRIYLAVDAADFRRGIDGLAGLCRSVLRNDPFSGAVFVFRNRARTGLKILVYDGQGFWLCYKRLSTGRFTWWPKSDDGQPVAVDAHDLQVLLWNGNPVQAGASPAWRRVSQAG